MLNAKNLLEDFLSTMSRFKRFIQSDIRNSYFPGWEPTNLLFYKNIYDWFTLSDYLPQILKQKNKIC